MCLLRRLCLISYYVRLLRSRKYYVYFQTFRYFPCMTPTFIIINSFVHHERLSSSVIEVTIDVTSPIRFWVRVNPKFDNIWCEILFVAVYLLLRAAFNDPFLFEIAVVIPVTWTHIENNAK